MKTLVIIGAGKGLGLSIAKRFGKEDFQVALVSRNAENLQKLVTELKEMGIEASYFTADIFSKEQIEHAISSIKEKYGQIDVVEFSPQSAHYPPTSVLELTIENARDAFEAFAASSINVVNTVLPDMLSKQEGALLFTTGFSSINPLPMMGNMGVGMGALRNYITNLHTELSDKGIFVGHRALALFITEPGTGTAGDPDVIADMWYQTYSEKKVWEEEYPKGITLEGLLSGNN